MNNRNYRKNTIVFTEGSPGDEMYIVISGGLRVFKTINGEDVELGSLGKYDFFGEISALLSTKRTASVETTENSTLMCLSREAVLTKMREDPKFAEKLITTLAQKLAQADEVIKSLAGEKTSLEIIYGVKK